MPRLINMRSFDHGGAPDADPEASNADSASTAATPAARALIAVLDANDLQRFVPFLGREAPAAGAGLRPAGGQGSPGSTPARRWGLVGETWVPPRLGHDLAALSLGGGAPPLALEHLAEGLDRDLELVERGLPRRQALQPEAGRQKRHENPAVRVLAGEADQLVGDARDHRQQQDPRR